MIKSVYASSRKHIASTSAAITLMMVQCKVLEMILNLKARLQLLGCRGET